jgi:hypothetical protein
MPLLFKQKEEIRAFKFENVIKGTKDRVRSIWRATVEI